MARSSALVQHDITIILCKVALGRSLHIEAVFTLNTRLLTDFSSVIAPYKRDLLIIRI